MTSSIPRIDRSSAGMVMTPVEFDAIEDYDDCYYYELVGGVLVVRELACAAEADASEYLGYLLWLFQENHENGAIIDAMLPRQYIYTQASRRLVNRVIWLGLNRRPDIEADPPSIVVDFVDIEGRDRLSEYSEKWMECQKAGVAEYWLVDRFRRMMSVFDSVASEAMLVSEFETHRPQRLPGFELPLARILAKADAWGSSQ